MRGDGARLVIAGTGTGCGKTTLTCGLARALTNAGMRVACAKCGPDYLDPTLLKAACGHPATNLDLYLATPGDIRRLLARQARDADATLIEGVMGLFDGIGESDAASTWAVATATETPVVLVADARSRSLTLAAEILGHLTLRQPSLVRGVILNRVGAARAERLASMVERECGVPVLGHVPTTAEGGFESRHLGLVPAYELADIEGRLDRLADTLAGSVDLDRLCALAATAAPIPYEDLEPVPPSAERPLIAVARDAAFCFTYPETTETLSSLGADLAFFSPISDTALPKGASGLILPGGYPELHAQSLTDNEAMRQAVRAAIGGGMPTIAECGGYLYLLETLADPDGLDHPMVAALPGHARRGRGLTHFGYQTMAARTDTLLAAAGETLRAHEFHHWVTDVPGDAFEVTRARDDDRWQAGFAGPSLFAAFGHLYLAGNLRAARRFVDACRTYARTRAGECDG